MTAKPFLSTNFVSFALDLCSGVESFPEVTELGTKKSKVGTRKYNVCLALCLMLGIAASAKELFGESLGLSAMALFYGAVVGAVSYIFSLCVMVLLGGVLRGRFGKQISNGLCWILLVATPPLAWLVASVTSARF